MRTASVIPKTHPRWRKDPRLWAFLLHTAAVALLFELGVVSGRLDPLYSFDSLRVFEYLDFPVGWLAFGCGWYLVYTDLIDQADVILFRPMYFTVFGGLQWVLIIWLVMRLRSRKASPFECGNCGYDLRGSLEIRRCPECGTPFEPPAQKGEDAGPESM
jgi:hypothetical protein